MADYNRNTHEISPVPVRAGEGTGTEYETVRRNHAVC